jgi:tRNA threonylcarbamoyl adenosine modification protein YeaZ
MICKARKFHGQPAQPLGPCYALRVSAVYLGIDTATAFLCLALWTKESTLEHVANLGRDHNKRLIPELDNLLSRAGLLKTDLAGIGVGLGPGSYTGLRVGLAAAKALAKGLNIPLSGESSLAASAYACLKEGQQGLVAFTARRNQVYAGLFERRSDDIISLQAVKKLELGNLVHYPNIPVFLDKPPDASFLARSVYRNDTSPVEPIYL